MTIKIADCEILNIKIYRDIASKKRVKGEPHPSGVSAYVSRGLIATDHYLDLVIDDHRRDYKYNRY